MVHISVCTRNEVILNLCKSLFSDPQFHLDFISEHDVCGKTISQSSVVLFDDVMCEVNKILPCLVALQQTGYVKVFILHHMQNYQSYVYGIPVIPFPCSSEYLRTILSHHFATYSSGVLSPKPLLVTETTAVYKNPPIEIPGLEHFNNDSPDVVKMKRAIAIATKIKSPVLLQGETGTGKSYIARVFHKLSERRNRPFVAVDCGAIPAGLAESHLFGVAKGAYTGALSGKLGYFGQADGGTLFLDEIENLSLEIQQSLLCVLDDGMYRMVGGDSRQCDVRLITASNIPLKECVKEKIVRTDLYNRISGMVISVPPLRCRTSDIKNLAKQFCAEWKMTLDEQALDRLAAYSWPGNIRELKRCIERSAGNARLTTDEPIIHAEQLLFND